MPENHLNFYLKENMYYVCLLKKVKSLDLRLTSVFLSKMLQTINLHWQKKNIHLKSCHVVWNPYILNNWCRSKPYQLDILFIFYEYFPDIAHDMIFP